jgi:hypothetical protein
MCVCFVLFSLNFCVKQFEDEEEEEECTAVCTQRSR